MDSFDPPVARTASRVRAIELRLLISEDDIPATESEPARTDTMYNGSYHFDILDQDGEVMEVRAGELNAHLTATRRGHVKGLLDFAMDKAKGSVPAAST